MKIVFFEIDDLESEILLDLYGDIAYDTVKEPLNAGNAGKYADAEIVSSFIYSELSREVLETLKNIKLISTRSRSTDHIDLEYCREKGIAVVNVPTYGEHTVAEHAFSLLLSLTRHIPQAISQIRGGSFSLQGLGGSDLYGKTIGVIGTGAIGIHAIRIAKGFGMTVLAYDINPKTDISSQMEFIYTDLDSLLTRSDIISLHIADTPATRHLLSEREFSLMQDGVIVINTAFGAAINVKALLQAISKGKVSAAGLDVLPDEPAIREEAELLRETFANKHDAETVLASHALLRHKNVIVTPHSAFYTRETLSEILRATGYNIQAFLESEALGEEERRDAIK